MKSLDKLAKKIWDAVLEFRDWATFVTPEVAETRYIICTGCVNFNYRTTQCKLCGCPMGIKTKLRGTYCPIGMWSKETN